MNHKKLTFIYLILLFFISFSAYGDIRLPHVLGNDMVMQRNIPLPVWGWSDPGESITVTFDNNSISVKADSDGNWKVTLPEMKAGGPYHMTVAGNNSVTIDNI